MAFCTKGAFNSLVTRCIPRKVVAAVRCMIGGDPLYYNNMIGPDVPNAEPESAKAPLAYDPGVCELPPELMFMHEGVFQEGEEIPDIDLKFPAYKVDWWEEMEADERITGGRGRASGRVERYLEQSEEVRG